MDNYKFKYTTMLTLNKELYDYLVNRPNVAGYLVSLVESDYEEKKDIVSCQDS